MIFVDTSAWYALEVEDDTNHRRASQFLSELRSKRFGSLLTSDYVLDETVTLLWLRKGSMTALAFLDKVNRSKSIHIVWIDAPIFWKTVDFMQERKDKHWSFTDFTSFLIMKQMNATSAFGFDENFQQAGFMLLPE
jgi:predicted nucleic acid-binding protein